MNCPVCHNKLHAIGERGFDNPIGYFCPTKIDMATGPISSLRGMETTYSTELYTTVSHYDTRGARTIINLPENYQIITWNHPLETYGASTILKFVLGYGYKEVFHCRELPIESAEKLLARIKLLAVFS